MALSYFCPHCGAEHAPDETLCHACQHPLGAPNTTTYVSTLLNERYEVLVEVGSGGFGAVYKARDTRENDRFVAVKQINLKGLSPQEIIEATDAFNREAQILSTLSHALLPRIFDRFNDPDHWYLVMNFIDGQTLDDYLLGYAIKALPVRAGLPLTETLAIGLQICDVLHYLHSQQPPVIFRDLKPGNIMRTARGHLYLIDFGIARRFKPGQAKDTIPFGSPGFAAPEQYGRAQTTPQADIYSLGALLYCLLSDDDPSEHPFQFPPLRLHKVEGLRELEALIHRMVALEPAQRPTDIQEVQSALQNIKHIHTHAAGKNAIWLPPPGQTPPIPTSPGSTQQHISFPPSPARKTTRRAVVTGSLALGGTILLGALATTLLRQNHDASSVSPAVATAIAQNAMATETTRIKQSAAVPTDGPTYWSPDLSHAAVVVNAGERQVDLYDTQSMQLLRTIKPSVGLSSDIFSYATIQWSPDNRKILFTPDSSITSVWDAKNGQQIFTFPLSSLSVDSPAITWSPTGEFLAIEYIDDSNFSNIPTNLVLLRASDGKRFFEKSFNKSISYSSVSSPGNNPVNILAWSPDSKYLLFPNINFAEVSANDSWSATIWQSKTSQSVGTLTIPIPWSIGQTLVDDTSLYISWSPSGNTIAIYYGKRIWICSLTKVKATYSLDSINYDSLDYGPGWSPNENFLAMILNGHLTILNVFDGRIIQCKSIDQLVPDYLIACAWSADSKSLTAADGNNIISHWSVG